MRGSATAGPNSSKGNAPPFLSVAAPVGVVAGTMGALCGVGGGLLIIPVLKTFSKLSMHQIAATSLCSISISSAFAAGSYISQGVADVPVATVLAVSAMMSSKAGAKLNHKLPAQTLSRLLGGGMLVAVPFILMKNTEEKEGDVNPTPIVSKEREDGGKFWLGKNAPTTVDEIPSWLRKNWRYIPMGMAVGYISALLGLGGGIMMTTTFSLSGHFSQHEAVATSLAAMVPVGFSATYWHMLAGHVHVKTALVIGMTSACSMYMAAQYIAPQLDEPTMRKIFAGLLTVSAVKMLL